MHVLVTGSTGALGDVVTRRLLDDGHVVTATWLVPSESQLLTGGPGRALLPVRVDVTDPVSIEQGLTQGRERFGPIAGLVHLVGAWAGGTRVEVHDPVVWEKMIAINLTSAFLCSRAVLPDMIEANNGRIVLVSSRSAHRDRAGQLAYAVAKAGVEVLVETIAEENRCHNVTANAVAPSTMGDSDSSAWVTPADVAAAISYLLGEPSGAIRGATLPLNGAV